MKKIPHNIYLASQYGRKEELRHYAFELESCGVRVTSTWLKEQFDPKMDLNDITPEQNHKVAKVDLEDIISSDTFIFFSEDHDKQPPRGSRHVEFGYALAQGAQIFVIGEQENIFHYLPEVTVYPTFQEFILAEVF